MVTVTKISGVTFLNKGESIMYLPLIHYVVHAEMQADRLRKTQYQNLINLIERDRKQNRPGRKVIKWLGTQMIAWGTKLQGSPKDTGCQETTLSVSVTVH